MISTSYSEPAGDKVEDDMLRRIEKENTIKSLENQVQDLKKENQVIKEILISKLDLKNEKNIAKHNILGQQQENCSNRRFNCTDVNFFLRNVNQYYRKINT